MNWTRMPQLPPSYRTLLGIGRLYRNIRTQEVCQNLCSASVDRQHILNPPLCLMQLGGRHHLHRRSYLTRTLDGAYSIFTSFSEAISYSD